MGKFTGRDIKIGIGKEKITGSAAVATAYAYNLITTGSPFTSTMVGAQVVKTSSPVAYSYVTVYVDVNTLTLNDDIFTATPASYEVAAPRGSAVAPVYWIPRRSFDFDDKALIVNDEQGLGVIEDASGARVVAKWAEGSITGVARVKAIGLLLLNTFGEVTASATVDSEVFAHIFTIRSNHQHPSLTIAVEDDLEELSYPLGMLKTLKLTAELGEMVLFTSELISKKGETASPVLTPAYIAEKDFAAQDIEVKFATATATLLAATATKVKSVEITMDGDVEKDDVLGSVDPADNLNKTIKVEIAVSRVYDANTIKGYFTSGTSKAMRVTIENDTTVLQSGGALYPKLEFDLNKVVITDWATTKDLDGIVLENFTAKAMFRIADSRMIKATLQNLVTKY